MDQCGQCGEGISFDTQPMTKLIENLESYVKRRVLDRTGLTGNYSFELTFSQQDPMFGARLAPTDSPPDNRPRLVDALNDQLGLKLTSENAPVDVLVIDRVEMPTPN